MIFYKLLTIIPHPKVVHLLSFFAVDIVFVQSFEMRIRCKNEESKKRVKKNQQ